MIIFGVILIYLISLPIIGYMCNEVVEDEKHIILAWPFILPFALLFIFFIILLELTSIGTKRKCKTCSKKERGFKIQQKCLNCIKMDRSKLNKLFYKS